MKFDKNDLSSKIDIIYNYQKWLNYTFDNNLLLDSDSLSKYLLNEITFFKTLEKNINEEAIKAHVLNKASEIKDEKIVYIPFNSTEFNGLVNDGLINLFDDVFLFDKMLSFYVDELVKNNLIPILVLDEFDINVSKYNFTALLFVRDRDVTGFNKLVFNLVDDKYVIKNNFTLEHKTMEEILLNIDDIDLEVLDQEVDKIIEFVNLYNGKIKVEKQISVMENEVEEEYDYQEDDEYDSYGDDLEALSIDELESSDEEDEVESEEVVLSDEKTEESLESAEDSNIETEDEDSVSELEEDEYENEEEIDADDLSEEEQEQVLVPVKEATTITKESYRSVHKPSVYVKPKRKFLSLLLKVVFLLVINYVLLYGITWLDSGYQINAGTIVALLIINFFIIVPMFGTKTKEFTVVPFYELTNLVGQMEVLEPTEEIYHDEELIEEEIVEVEEYVFDEDYFITSPKQIIKQTHIFDENLDLITYINDLNKYMRDYGVETSVNNNRELLSSFIANKVIYLNHEDKAVSFNYIKIFAEFVGANFYSGKNLSDTLEDENLSRALNSALEREDLIHIVTLNNYDLLNSENFTRVVNYSKYPNLEEYIVINNVKYKINNNVWFVILDSEPIKPTRLDIAVGSISLMLDAKFVIPVDQIKENVLKISSYRLVNLINSYENVHFLSDEVWEKFDRLEAYVNRQEQTIFSNLVERQVESFLTIYLATDGDEMLAVDAFIAGKVLDMVSHYNLVRDEETEVNFFHYLTSIFEGEILQKSNITNNLFESLKEIEEDDSNEDIS